MLRDTWSRLSLLTRSPKPDLYFFLKKGNENLYRKVVWQPDKRRNFFQAFQEDRMGVLKYKLLFNGVLLPQLSCHFFLHEISFYPLIFSLCGSLSLKWVSCRHHINGYWCLSNQPPYVFTGKFDPVTFKVIIDGYVHIAILLLVFWLFFQFFTVQFFLFLFLLLSFNDFL